MAFMDEVLDRVLEVVGRIGRAALVPWGGAETCVDAYENAIWAVTDTQLQVARAVGVEPVRSALASSAQMTRDIGAVHLSSMRWFLDV